MHPTPVDPYQFFEITYDSSEEEIQAAFQEKLKKTSDRNTVIQIYASIRDQASRNSWRWDQMGSLLYTPQQKTECVDHTLLIRELAFLTPWELGDDTCLKS